MDDVPVVNQKIVRFFQDVSTVADAPARTKNIFFMIDFYLQVLRFFPHLVRKVVGVADDSVGIKRFYLFPIQPQGALSLKGDERFGYTGYKRNQTFAVSGTEEKNGERSCHSVLSFPA